MCRGYVTVGDATNVPGLRTSSYLRIFAGACGFLTISKVLMRRGSSATSFILMRSLHCRVYRPESLRTSSCSASAACLWDALQMSFISQPLAAGP